MALAYMRRPSVEIFKLPNDAYGLKEWYGRSQKLDREKKTSGGDGGAPEPDPLEGTEPASSPDVAPDPDPIGEKKGGAK